MLLLLLAIVGAMYVSPLMMNTYSPLPALMSPWSDRVHVYGQVVYENQTPAVGVDVKMFATDELITDIVYTDSDGYFISSVLFDTGQVITVTINGERVRVGNAEPFVDYNAQENQGPFWIGIFIIGG